MTRAAPQSIEIRVSKRFWWLFLTWEATSDNVSWKSFWDKILQGQGQMQNLKFRNLHEILALEVSHVMKNDQIRLLTRISMPCGAALGIKIWSSRMGTAFLCRASSCYNLIWLPSSEVIHLMLGSMPFRFSMRNGYFENIKKHVFFFSNFKISIIQTMISKEECFVPRLPPGGGTHTYSMVVMVGPLCPGKSFWDEISQGQGQMQNRKFRNFHEILTLVASHVRKNHQIRSLTRIWMPCGAALVISNCIWLVETVVFFRPSNLV